MAREKTLQWKLAAIRRNAPEIQMSRADDGDFEATFAASRDVVEVVSKQLDRQGVGISVAAFDIAPRDGKVYCGLRIEFFDLDQPEAESLLTEWRGEGASVSGATTNGLKSFYWSYFLLRPAPRAPLPKRPWIEPAMIETQLAPARERSGLTVDQWHVVLYELTGVDREETLNDRLMRRVVNWTKNEANVQHYKATGEVRLGVATPVDQAAQQIAAADNGQAVPA